MDNRSYQTLHTVLEQLGSPAVVFRSDALIVVCTGACEKLLGLFPGQANGHRLSDLGLKIIDETGAPWPDKGLPLWRNKERKEEGTSFIFGVHLRQATEPLWLKATMKPGRAGEGWDDHIFMTLADVTDHISKNLAHAQIYQAKNEWETTYKEDVTISPVLDGSGKIVNYVALKRDATREEMLEQQLHQAMKMEALG
ncbi:MAG: hypothetical protein V2B20_18315, partial [Pseudomonadota bacterium]